MPSQPGAQSGDCGRGAAEGASELAMGGSGLETGGNGKDELGALEVIGDGERLFGERTVAGTAAIAGHASAVTTGIGSDALVGEGASRVERVLGAVLVRAESGNKTPLNLRRLNRPVHGLGESSLRAAEKGRNGANPAPRPSARRQVLPPGGHPSSTTFAPP